MAITKRGRKTGGPTGASANGSAAGGASKGTARKGVVAKADWKDSFKKRQVGVSDMTLLSTISNDAINDNLKKRFENGEIYTYIGHVLISVNPFRMLPIYGDDVLFSYRGKNRLEMAPHVYSIAETAFYNMTSYKENQCVIISGESGAGKTEAAKRIMQYIAAVAGAGQSKGISDIKDMVLATNPLLESFGCAKTLRNNNSSRHGKYLEIEFDAQGNPVGAMITNYLLEKNRVTSQIQNERNFHIFYQMTKGASEEQRQSFGIQEPSTYAYISKSKCLEVAGIDDVADWADTLKAMNVIGISPAEQHNILRSLAAVLWIGNVTFREDESGNAFIADQSVPPFVAYLLEVEESQVSKVMTSRVMETTRGGRRGSVYEVPLNRTQATAVRDALARALYNNLFEWIVARINVSMKARGTPSTIIGVLDIYGFEIFDTNQFEQLCINYVNEKLQQIFIQLTLKTEQEEYVREQIKWTPINYFNNKVVCDLIEEKRPPGVFAALNDACATAHADPSAADNSFVQRMGGISNPQFESRGSKFLIKHYAGDVMYTVGGMTEKNKDVLLKDLLDLVSSSKNSFIQALFPDRPDPNSKKRPPTASDRIKESANALVEKLMRSQPSYIRTIKPNQNRSPTEYDSKAILHQIKYLGLQENIRVRRAGFAYRNTFEKIVERFYLLSPATSYAGDYIWQGDARSGCEKILKDTGIARDEWQMGVTKAFIKNPETLFALENMRDKYWHNMAARIQRAFRAYMRHKNDCARKIQRFWLNQKEGIAYAQLRDYGNVVLGQRKERRRFSLLGQRKFLGDYLLVNGDGIEGSRLHAACGLAAGESAVFSARAQVLVSKFGRSSTRSPRTLILTQKSLYLLANQAVNGTLVTSIDRKFAVRDIRSISMSNLQDDWMVLHLSATRDDEGDALICCTFKTELATRIVQLSGGSVSVAIASQIEYNKKKGKLAKITFAKDEAVRNEDVYKSHTVKICTGEPASSVSRPMPQRKLRASNITAARKRANPASTQARPTASTAGRGPAVSSLPTKRAAPVAKQTTGATVPTNVRSNGVATPPQRPPPPPAPKPAAERYEAIYPFETNQPGEMALSTGDVLEVVQKDEGGWWLVKKGSTQGWTPSNYLQLIQGGKPAIPAKPRLP